MRIKTQFIVTMLLFGVILAAISVSAVVTNQLVKQANGQELLAQGIARGAGEMSYLANDYVIYGESQYRERWQNRFDSFSADVARLDADGAEPQALVRNIQANSRRLEEVFVSVVASVESLHQEQGGTVDLSLLQVSWSRMAIQSQGLVSDAARLSQLLNEEVDGLQATNTVVMVALVCIFIGYFVVNFLATQRRVLGSVATLQAGAAIIGGGDLDFKIEEKRNDEIGDLARAFNRMTADLKTVTASKTDLEREVEERKRMQVALMRSEEQFRRAIEEAPIPVIMYSEDGRVLQISHSWTRLTGYIAQDMLAFDAWLNTAYGEGAEKVREHVRQLFKGDKSSIHIEFPIRTKGDELRYWSFSASSPGNLADGQRFLVGMAEDITERKQAEVEIAHLASFPELNPNPIVELDASGNIKYANPAAIKLFPDLMAQGNRHPFLSDAAKSIRTAAAQPVTLNIGIGDAWYEQTMTYVPGSQTYRLYSRDMTLRKRAEEDLQRINIELEASNKELEAFSYSVSHDLRAPLRSMEGFSTALLEDYADKLDDQGRQFLCFIQEASDLMGRLIDDLLKLSRVTRSEMSYEVVDLSKIAATIVAELQKTDPRRKMKVAIAPGITAYGDRNLLRLVLDNLLGNAWKFCGKASVTRIEMGTIEHNGGQAYFVRDNGVGFDMKYADKLFKPFQRLHKASDFAGTGIGLATVQRVVRRHGGEVWAESRVGEGATFYFTLGQL
jgi:PAS domain S-box-containing protein